MTYDTQWRVTCFLSMDYALACSLGKTNAELAASARRFPSPAEKTTEDFKRQPETRSSQTPRPVWFYI
jgi:hypothetical protein